MGEVNVFSLKVIVVFGLCFFCWLVRVLSSKKYVCCVCDPIVSRCSLLMSDVSVCMRDVISEFNSEIEESLVFCALMLFLCSILCLMCCGCSLHVECILPFGMLCLSAWRMMFVKMVFSVCMCGGG